MRGKILTPWIRHGSPVRKVRARQIGRLRGAEEAGIKLLQDSAGLPVRQPNRISIWLGLMLWWAGASGSILGADASAAITVLTFSGKAEVSRQGDVWDPAYTNQVLLPGNKMRTGLKSRATLRLSDGTTMTVGAEARFEVPQEKRGITLNPFKGLYYFFHRDKPGQFELRSRTAAAAVRGTEFQLEAAAEGDWTLSVLDGDVLLQSEGGELELRTGQAGQVKPGAKPQTVIMRDATDLIQWCFYYPAVLDADELKLTPAEQTAARASLDAWRQGDRAGALEQFNWDAPVSSSLEALYRAQLLLAVGDVTGAEQLLNGVPSASERAGSLKIAITELIAVVKGRARTPGAPAASSGRSRGMAQNHEPRSEPALPQSASAWLAESYRRQAELDLDGALAAVGEATTLAPDFALAWERRGELEFSFGHLGKARRAAEQALRLAPRGAPVRVLLGFLAAAEERIDVAREQFETAIAQDGAQGNAWLGRGLCRIRAGDLDGGRQDLIVAAALEPQRASFRSYLGKAWAESGNSERAGLELQLAQRLDPKDPTSWLYSALLLLEQNRINEAIAALQRSEELNDNRALFRSRLLLDQDRAVRGANLAAVYQDAGMDEVAVREASKAVERDYGNFSAHQFLANSYNALRDPQQVNLRYETAWLNEYLVANLLAPVGAGTLSPMVSQQEYSRLFQQNGLGLISETTYSSRGDWSQAAVQYGQFDHTDYAVESTYSSRNGERFNNDLELLTLSLRLKQQLSPRDTLYFQAIGYDAEGGDLAQYYSPSFANGSLRITETQQPMLLAGYHHEWAPGIHTLVLAGRLQDRVEITNAAAGSLFFRARSGVNTFASYALYNQAYESEQETYISELQQSFQFNRHTLISGARYQAGEFDTASVIQNGATFPGGTPTGFNPVGQNFRTHLQRSGFYLYDQWRPFDSLLLIGGLSADWITYPDNYQLAPLAATESSRHLLGPKAGFVWTPTALTTIRGAYSRALGGVSFDQSFRLEPSQVAGFNQAFRSLIPEAIGGSPAAPAFEIFGLQLEERFASRSYLGVTAGLLWSDATRQAGAVVFDPFPAVPTPDPFSPTSTRQHLDFEERNFIVSLHQLLGRDFAVGAVYRLSQANLVSEYPDLPSTAVLSSPFVLRQEQEATMNRIRLYGIFNHPEGYFAEAEALWTAQDNRRDSSGLADEDFWQFNLYAGYRWWHRRAEVRLGLLNLTAQDYRLNPLNVIAELPRQRTFTLSFRFSF